MRLSRSGVYAAKPSRETFESLYVTQRLPPTEIASRLGVSETTVHKWRRSFGIPTYFAMTPPPKERLAELYVGQLLSAAKVGEVLNAGKRTILNWLDHYGIRKRPSGIRLIDREDVTLPTKKRLEQLIHRDRKQYREIAKLLGLKKSTIANLVDRYGIKPLDHWSARTRTDHHTPTIEELQQLYVAERWPTVKVANAFGLSRSAILCHLKKHGLTRRKGTFQTKDGEFVRSGYELMVDDWLYDGGFAHEYEPRVPFSKRHRADFKIGNLYIEIWGIVNVPEYEQTKQWKIGQYRKHSLDLLQIHGKDFPGGRWLVLLRNALCGGQLF